MQNMIELLKDHALMEASIKSLSALSREAQPRPEAAFDTLHRLARLLETHLRDEEEFLNFDREQIHPEFIALADAHGARFRELLQEWEIYLHEWSAERIGGDWAAFGEATCRIMARLSEQVETENQALYPAALRYGLIRLTPEQRVLAR